MFSSGIGSWGKKIRMVPFFHLPPLSFCDLFWGGGVEKYLLHLKWMLGDIFQIFVSASLGHFVTWLFSIGKPVLSH